MTGREITIAAYAVLALAIAVVELASRPEGSEIPTFSEMVSLVTSVFLGRVALIALWWWLGWHFLARSGPPSVTDLQ